MIIQFNTDHNIAGTEALREPLIALITEELSRYSAHITRVEVHLTDQDGKKHGQEDKRCVLEARLEGMQPIAVTKDAGSRDQAVAGALDKLKASLETVLGRQKTRSINDERKLSDSVL